MSLEPDTDIDDKTTAWNSLRTGVIPQVEIPASTQREDNTLVVRFFDVEEDYYADYLTAVLNHLPSLLTVLSKDQYQEQIEALADIYLPSDWAVERDLLMQGDGIELVEEFFKSVPVFTKAQVQNRLSTTDPAALSNLQSITYQGREFYPADQFSEDGQPLAEHAHIMKILRQDKNINMWSIATWWFYSTGWLSGLNPIDVLLDTPDQVQVAAEQERGSIV